MLGGSLPLDSNGVLALPQQPERKIVSKFLQHRGVSYEVMQEILEEKFGTFLEALVKGDEL